jgi:hypothetical protein
LGFSNRNNVTSGVFI